VQALGRPSSKRLTEFRPRSLIVDEAHHAAADTYQRVMRRFGCYEGECFTVGVTATPHRMDNKALHGSDEAIFEDVAFTYTLREAIGDGWLADLKGYRVATGIDLSKVKVRYGDYSVRQLQDAVNVEHRNLCAFENWEQVADGRRTIVFCTGIEHAEDVAKLFREKGYEAESVNGRMKPEVRRGVMERFRQGVTQVLTNVDIATEGFDVPEASCVLMLRPTQSWALYTQMIGRGLRTLSHTIEGLGSPEERRQAVRSSAKPDCMVIDVVDNGLSAAAPKPHEEGAEPERPTLTAVLGLPPELDLEGHSMEEALKIWNSLEPARRAVLFRRPTRFDDLGTTLTAVDLLAELSVPEEMAQVSKLAWMKVGDGEYLLPCGSASSEPNRIARLHCDPLGRHRLTLESSTRRKEYDCGEDLNRAFHLADRQIKEIWPFIGGLVSARGRWRKDPPTPEQINELLQLGIDRALVDQVDTAGQAWTLIELKRSGR
jgi:ATP-dependent helicase IRC3